MFSDNDFNYGGSIDFGTLLTVLFVGLKLTHFINWSWWWVLSPLWISAGVLVVALVIAFIIYMWLKRNVA